MDATVLEFDPLPGVQILDRAREQHFVRTGLCHNARAYIQRDTAGRVFDNFALAGMKTRSDLQSESADRFMDRGRTSDCPCCPRLSIESSEYAITGSGYFFPPGCAKLSAKRCVIMTQHLIPSAIAELRGLLRRPDYIDEDDRDKNAARLGSTANGTKP
jgi:hypothetical protein